MRIDLDSLGFWGELEIKYKGSREDSIEEFYKKYQKILRDIYKFPDDMEKSVKQLIQLSYKEKEFFLEVYLTNLETKINFPQLSNIKLKDISLDQLERYSRLLVRRLNVIDRINKPYSKPEGYTIPYLNQEKNRIWFVIKKRVGQGTKAAKRKRVYPKYKDELVIITKQKDHWKLRSSFSNMREKGVLKGVFSSKKIVICKEDKLKDILKKILEKYPITEISGHFYKNKKKVEYGFLCENDAINDLAEDELKFLLDNDVILNDVNKVRFELRGNAIGFKIVPHKFNVKHLKLVTTGLTKNKIWVLSSILNKDLNLEDDVYIIDSKDKLIRQKFILNSENINEINLSILKKDIDYLNKDYELIRVDYRNSFKICLNPVCFHYENKDIFELKEKICKNCDEKLVRLGASCKIKRRLQKITEYLISALKASDFTYKGSIVKKSNRTKFKLLKFQTKTKKFLVYVHDGKTNLKKTVDFFTEKNYPVLVVLQKNGIGEDIDPTSLSIEKVCFPDLFAEYEEKNVLSINDFIMNIHVKQEAASLRMLAKAEKILRSFVSLKFDGQILDGKTIQRKGNTFEKLVNHILKPISKSWVELGQEHQSKSVPDGFGYMAFGDKNYAAGFDSKLKLSPNSRGLSKKEVENQDKYITSFKKHSYGFGGLKSWVIVVKSSEDYPKFKNSVKKLKIKSGFSNLVLLGLEPLLKICEIFDDTRKDVQTNKEIFDEFFYKILRYRGNVTDSKIKRVLTPLLPKFRNFNVKI